MIIIHMYIYATLIPYTYTVSYALNGGSGTFNSQTKTYGNNLTLYSTTPTKFGSTFKHWLATDGTTYSTGNKQKKYI